MHLEFRKSCFPEAGYYFFVCFVFSGLAWIEFENLCSLLQLRQLSISQFLFYSQFFPLASNFRLLT